LDAEKGEDGEEGHKPVNWGAERAPDVAVYRLLDVEEEASDLLPTVAAARFRGLIFFNRIDPHPKPKEKFSFHFRPHHFKNIVHYVLNKHRHLFMFSTVSDPLSKDAGHLPQILINDISEL
jgi:hypothetical protein